MFSVEFYNCTENEATLGKNLGTASSAIKCTPFMPLSDLHGQITVDYDANWEGYNYCRIYANGTEEHPEADGLTRYCFIRDFTKQPGGHLTLDLEIDPLETYSQAIRESEILATRSSVVGRDDGNVGYNAYIHDGLWKIDATTLYYLSDDLMKDDPFNYDVTILDGDTKQDYFVLMTAG